MALSGQFNEHGLQQPTPEGFEKVVEGFAAVLFPPAKPSSGAAAAERPRRILDDGADEEGDNGDQSIFYNPAQVVNRDLSICAIEAFSRLRPTEPPRRGGTKDGITILEALSATGLRALRYWQEITGVKYIIANDLDADAVQCIRRNCAYNDIPVVEPTLAQNCPEGQRGVIANHDNAIHLMQRLSIINGPHSGGRYALLPSLTPSTTEASSASATPREAAASPSPLLQQELMDVVDLDPYGTASPFLDSAFATIKEGGLMLVTSTDSPILCGNYPDTCHAKYNSLMMKPDACHEVAVRILLAAVERAANKYKKYIVPLISLHIDFYIRVFFRVYTQAAEAKLATAKLAHVAHCTRCPSFWISPIGRVKESRKSVAAKRRRQQEEGEGEEKAATEQQPTLATASYPTPPSRTQPFKVSCPTIDTWLPRAESAADQHLCPVCKGHISVGGPIYAAPTQDRDFLEKLLAVVDERASEGRITATDRVRGLIIAARDELPDCPLFYSLPEVASFARVRCPPTPIFVGALSRLGYKFSQVHCHRSGIKTTCPPTVLIQAMMAFKDYSATASAIPTAADTHANEAQPQDKQPIKENKKSSEDIAKCILPPLQGLDFTYDRAYDFRSQVTGVAKFIPNAPGWGPKRRHQGVADGDQ